MADKKGNSGYSNSGYSNSGNSNSGDSNSGYRNSGNRNSGDSNSGYRNSGNRNSGSWNSGFLCTDKPLVRIFNKETQVSRDGIDFPEFFYFDLAEWVESSDMTDQEKADHPFWETTRGYLKTYDYNEAWKSAWDKADEDDRAKLFNLPNFDADIFKEITGIDVAAEADPTINEDR